VTLRVKLKSRKLYLSGVTTAELEIEALKSLIFENAKSGSAFFILLIQTKKAGGRVNFILFGSYCSSKRWRVTLH
jgi:hypothetical protein